MSGIFVGDHILGKGEEKGTLRVGFLGAVLDQEDGNLVWDGRGSSDVGYGSDGSER